MLIPLPLASQLYHLYDLHELRRGATLPYHGAPARRNADPPWPTRGSTSPPIRRSPGVPLAGPLYKDVKRQLMEVLTRGEWKAGEAIPAERRLAERYGISIGTVRKAIDELVAENILIRQQGRGTYVASHNRDRLLFYFFHIVPEQGPKEYPQIRLLSFTRAKADRTAACGSRSNPATRCCASATCCRPRRHAGDHRRPHAPRRALPGAHREALPRSTVDDLQPVPGSLRGVGRADQRAAASRGGRCRDRGAAGLVRSAPLLQIRRLALTYNDAPVELRVSLVNTAHYEYFSDIGRN